MRISKVSQVGKVQFHNGINRISSFIKRGLDLFVSIIGIILLFPIFILISIGIKRDTPGPVIYRGIRVGRKGKLFRILKFRTMVENEEAHNGNNITAQDDPRITRFGRFLRDTKLNELPQLVNVLKGEMSLVGPRPEDPTFLKHYSQEQREVLSVRPGVTSLASVLYADEENMLHAEDVTETYLHSIMPQKLRLDLLYIRNRSFLLDLDIIFRSIFVFFPRFRHATLSAEDIVQGPFRFMRFLASWFALDALIALMAIALAGFIWRTAGPLDVGLGPSILAAFLMTFVFTGMNWATGVQRIHWKYATASDAVGLIISVFASTFLLHVINVLFILPSYPSEMLLMAGLLALIGFLSLRYRRQLLTGLQVRLSRIRTLGQAARERVLVVGAGEAGQLTLWLLQNSPSARAFYVVGVVDDDLNKLGSLVHRVPVLGLCERIPQLVEEHDVGMILFAIHSIHWQRRNEILEICWSTSARTVVAPDILTFMRKGTDPSDRRTWFPEAEAEDNEVGPSNGFTKDELRQDIHRLAQMARHGDYAELARYLIELDRELQTGSKEVASKKIDIAA